MKQIFIVGSGEDYTIEKIQKTAAESEFIIASDGGYETLLKAGIRPGIIIGDFDSISPDIRIPEDIKIERHPAEKDLSDSELCLQYALALCPERVVMAAVTGSYLDHSFANILNIFRNMSKLTEIHIITSNSTIRGFSEGEYLLENLAGRRVSLFFPVPVEGIELSGFRYTFGTKVPGVFEYSLSNIIEQDPARICIKSGAFILFLFDGGYE